MSYMIYLFETNSLFFLGSVFVLGLMVGSFLNVVIVRLPKMMERSWTEQCQELLNPDCKASENNELPPYNLIIPRSKCPNCEHKISALENIPVLSYLFLKGKCKSCNNKISIKYPTVELLTAILSIVVAYYFNFSMQTLFALLITWTLIVLSFIDFEHQLLPDDITIPLLWLGIIASIFNIFIDLETSIIGAIFGYGSLWLIYIFFKLITGKEGMGYGDFKLFAALGAWFGWQFLPLIIIISSFLGAIIGICMITFKSHNKSIPIPFGPYLAISGWISLLWGNDIIFSYINFIN